ncbi:hypothetical protein VSK92_17475 [Bacillus swezeyi]|uniref:hypothetical protein n=1 Tax=Bacillus swezeyi TaxID=1925020 RepID=UPI0039C62683
MRLIEVNRQPIAIKKEIHNILRKIERPLHGDSSSKQASKSSLHFQRAAKVIYIRRKEGCFYAKQNKLAKEMDWSNETLFPFFKKRLVP